MAFTLLGRFKVSISRHYGSVRMNSTSRKMAFPLVKALHPDMYARESTLVQSTNILCIQNLNSLWDCIDTLIQEVTEAAQQKRTSVDVKMAFRSDYLLDCYHRSTDVSKPNESSSGEQSLTKHAFKIVVPDVLRSKCTIPLERARQELNMLFGQQGIIFIKLGLKDPWSSLREKSPNLRDDIDFDEDVKTEREVDVEIETKLFEQRQRISRYGAGFTWVSAEYKPNSIKGQHHGKLSKKEWGEHKVLKDRLEKDIDLWIRKGNLLLQNVAVEEEVPAVRKVREFVLTYSTVINFNLHFWSSLMFVVEPARTKPAPVRKASAGPVLGRRSAALAKKASLSQEVAAPTAAPNTTSASPSSSSSSELSTVAYSKYGFSHSVLSESRVPIYVLRIPSNFNESRLLDYLSSHIPIANPMRDLRGMKAPPESVFREAGRGMDFGSSETSNNKSDLKNARRVF